MQSVGLDRGDHGLGGIGGRSDFAAHGAHVVAHGGHDFPLAGQVVLLLPEPVGVAVVAGQAGLDVQLVDLQPLLLQGGLDSYNFV